MTQTKRLQKTVKKDFYIMALIGSITKLVTILIIVSLVVGNAIGPKDHYQRMNLYPG